jgi:hypothetical protein
MVVLRLMAWHQWLMNHQRRRNGIIQRRTVESYLNKVVDGDYSGLNLATEIWRQVPWKLQR